MTSRGMPVVHNSHSLPSPSAASFSSSRTLTGWHGAHTRDCMLMKKHIQLARKTCKLLQLRSACDTAVGSSLGSAWDSTAVSNSRLTDLNSRERRSLRCYYSNSGSETWYKKAFSEANLRREADEHARSNQQFPSRQHARSRSSSSGLQAVDNQSSSAQAPNSPAEALWRATPSDPAHHSHQYAPPVSSAAQSAGQPTSKYAPQGSKVVAQSAFTAVRPAEHAVQQQPMTEADVVDELQHEIAQLAQLDITDEDGVAEAAAAAEPAMPHEIPADICVVDTPAEARRIVQLIKTEYSGMLFACDTEVMDIDLSKESPCGHGIVTCVSIYGGRHDGTTCNFAADTSSPVQDQVWVDTLLEGDKAASKEMFDILKEFFEDAKIKKVWHNYSFDRHVLGNHGINCQGFRADTMHMARLWDSSRQGKGYSLESLTGDKKLMADYASGLRSKTGMKTLFGRKNIKKDNTEGKLNILPPVEELQTDPDTRAKWIDYSAYDAKATWQLAMALRKALMNKACNMDWRVQQAADMKDKSMFDTYNKYWHPFGLLLTDMEKEGMSVNRAMLADAEVKANQDQAEAMNRFRSWATKQVPGAQYMNVGSGAQIRQLLFAGVDNQKPEKGVLEHEKVFKALNTEGWIDPNGKSKKPKKHIDFTLFSLWGQGTPPLVQPEIFTASGWPAVSTPVLRGLAGKPGAAKRALYEQFGDEIAMDASEDIPLESLLDSEDIDSSFDSPSADMASASKDDDMEAIATESSSSRPAVAVRPTDAAIVQMDAEAASKGFGKAYAAFGGGREGLEACAAIDALCELGAIDTLLSNFIRPLQGGEIATLDKDGNLGRIHCSLNINTETGRLSARRPNLQNQPALEKDRYKVRKAFTADTSKGHTLVVADYGQLELRILAHMADCKSMITAFKLGGDFHSRTALGMYDHIKEAINKGECMLEWGGEGKSPVPLLKDMFANERRKAKVLNFSIAYGKTAHGLSKDWKTSLQEAENTVERWYADRPEVRLWQNKQQTLAKNAGYVCTLLGRQRQLPDASKKGVGSGAARGHALRAAINTPVQGSAADVATAAMISINNNQMLKDLGWKLLLQVHDEVILEGPKESAQQAQRLLLDCMERPFDGQNPLLVELVVDSKIADTWYEAK